MTEPEIVRETPPQAAPATRPGVAIVGASSGIGAALAHAYAQRGYQVALLARRGDRLDAIAREINAGHADGEPPRARVYVHDVADVADAPELFERIRADMRPGRLTTLVYASGVLPQGTGGMWSFEDQRAMIETNALGAMRWLDLAAERFAQEGGGTLIGISSVAGDRGRPGNSAYMASKAALSAYLESLRYRLARRGVRVVTVKPGYVASEMTAGMRLPPVITASPEAVARRVVAITDRGPSVVYVPGIWRFIMAGVRLLPAALMARLPA